MSEGPQKIRELPTAYEPQQIEERWAREWVDSGLYKAENSGADDGATFCIVIPPPNVTGYIHIGHMLEHTQIDALTRWHRMRGERTLWLPGMDHAGISTQVVVERELAKQNLTRQQIGREEFERRAWEWKAQSGGTIKKQMMRLGDSCDWSREKFTLDPPLYRAVLEAFLRLYREGLIYRGRYIVNWCPRCQTALSDLETVHEDRNGHLWHLRYPVVGSDEFIVVATTRPETMLGDTAVAVHPDDERYKHLIGKTLRLPLMNREIPVIADAAVEREFGTGAVKVTPAHDPNDFEMGRRHSLPEIDVMTEDAHMNANAGAYAGLDRFAARKRIVADLEAQGLLVKVENHAHSIGICDRCKTVVEPRISTQWFCKMRGLADVAVHSVESGNIRIVPENQRKIFLDWMANIRDWCISRQLWWGHRIPVWHCPCGGMTPARDSKVEIVNGHARPASPPEKCDKCGGTMLEQDKDVLDTWFSSGLWPLSTLGWPDDTPDLRKFYPTTLLISGYDILFFWDARMVMMDMHLAPERMKSTGERVPFPTLYLHSLVRDAQGQKMSKMRGNVINPLDWLEKYGTDALRFTLAIKAAPGTDIALSEDAVLSYRAFANKIWNAARFLFVNLQKFDAGGDALESLAAPETRAGAPYAAAGELPLIDRWMFSRLARVVPQVNEALAEFRFHEAAHAIYHFFWGDFCDWYIEWNKPRLNSADREVAGAAWRNIFAVYEGALRLLHPFMPFITEEIWHSLPQAAGAKSISLAEFPAPPAKWIDERAEREMAQVQEIIVAARNLRAEMKLDPKKPVAADFASQNGDLRASLERNAASIKQLTPLSSLTIAAGRMEGAANGNAMSRSTAEFDLRIPYSEIFDPRAEIAKLRKEIERLEKDIASKERQLGDQTFRSRAPAHIIQGMERTLEERRVEKQKASERLIQLGASSPA